MPAIEEGQKNGESARNSSGRNVAFHRRLEAVVFQKSADFTGHNFLNPQLVR